MRVYLSILLVVLTAGAYAEDVALKGGAKIQAPLLKDADDAVVLDLGYDVLRIPRNEVLAVYEAQPPVKGTVGLSHHSKILRQEHSQLFIVVTLATDATGQINDINAELLKLGEILLAMGISDLSRIAGRMLCFLETRLSHTDRF